MFHDAVAHYLMGNVPSHSIVLENCALRRTAVVLQDFKSHAYSELHARRGVGMTAKNTGLDCSRLQ